jgi:hypothetical protein
MQFQAKGWVTRVCDMQQVPALSEGAREPMSMAPINYLAPQPAEPGMTNSNRVMTSPIRSNASTVHYRGAASAGEGFAASSAPSASFTPLQEPCSCSPSPSSPPSSPCPPFPPCPPIHPPHPHSHPASRPQFLRECTCESQASLALSMPS